MEIDRRSHSFGLSLWEADGNTLVVNFDKAKIFLKTMSFEVEWCLPRDEEGVCLKRERFCFGMGSRANNWSSAASVGARASSEIDRMVVKFLPSMAIEARKTVGTSFPVGLDVAIEAPFGALFGHLSVKVWAFEVLPVMSEETAEFLVIFFEGTEF